LAQQVYTPEQIANTPSLFGALGMDENRKVFWTFIAKSLSKRSAKRSVAPVMFFGSSLRLFDFKLDYLKSRDTHLPFVRVIYLFPILQLPFTSIVFAAQLGPPVGHIGIAVLKALPIHFEFPIESSIFV
jgi:hypothetical protein